MNFKNMKELMMHLVSGGAITNLDDSCKSCWISLYQGNLKYNDREEVITDLGPAESWRPVPVSWLTDHIQKNTKKVKLL